MFEGEAWEEQEEEPRAEPEEGWGLAEGRGLAEGGAASLAYSFVLRQSYICALVSMMAWSISYVSWLTCVLLLWSCVLWMMRERRRYTLMSSPWLVTYGNLLLVLQYVYSFPTIQEVPGLFPQKEEPCRELLSKVLTLLLAVLLASYIPCALCFVISYAQRWSYSAVNHWAAVRKK